MSENAVPEAEDTAAMLDSLKAVTVSTLPEEVRTYELRDETGEDGVRRIDVTAGLDGVGQVNLFFDAGTLPQEDIHYMRLYTRLLGQMDTDAHTKEELPVLIQANSEFFLRRNTSRMALKMLRQGQIHLLGSDCHNLSSRKPDLGAAVERIISHLGEEALHDVMDCQSRIIPELQTIIL